MCDNNAKSICKETRSTSRKTGKTEYFKTKKSDSSSSAYAFFTGDSIDPLGSCKPSYGVFSEVGPP